MFREWKRRDYQKKLWNVKKWHLVGFSYPHEPNMLTSSIQTWHFQWPKLQKCPHHTSTPPVQGRTTAMCAYRIDSVDWGAQKLVRRHEAVFSFTAGTETAKLLTLWRKTSFCLNPATMVEGHSRHMHSVSKPEKWFYFEVKRSEWRWSSWGQMYPVHYGDPILRVLDCIVTVSCGVCLVLWLFWLVLWCVGVCECVCVCVVCVGFVMCGCAYVWVL
jgi:hypothetical protein